MASNAGSGTIDGIYLNTDSSIGQKGERVSFLMHFFAPDWRLAESLALDEPLLKMSISRFLDAHKTKLAAIEGLENGVVERALPPLRLALADELAMIAGSEKTEKAIQEELASFSHKEHSEALTTLEKTLSDNSARCQYVYRLMQELYSILQDEAHMVACLSNGSRDQIIMNGLVEKIRLENQVIQQLTKNEDFMEFFQRLARGERKRYELQHLEGKFGEEIYERLLMTARGGNVPLQVTGDEIARLTSSVFSKIMDIVIGAVNDGTLDKHRNRDFEFVNNKAFEDYALSEVYRQNLNLDRKVFPQFVKEFREYYNERVRHDVDETG